MEWTPVERLGLHFNARGPAPLTPSVKHTMRTTPLITLGVLLTAPEFSAAGQNIPTNWLTIERSAFSVPVPPDMTNQPLQEAGTSTIQGCVSSNIVLTFAYYSDPGGTLRERPLDAPGYKRTITAIGGHAAEIKSYHIIASNVFLAEGKSNVIRLYAPKVGKDGSNSLNIVTYCHSEADYAISQGIFESIRFKKE